MCIMRIQEYVLRVKKTCACKVYVRLENMYCAYIISIMRIKYVSCVQNFHLHHYQGHDQGHDHDLDLDLDHDLDHGEDEDEDEKGVENIEK